MLAHCDIIAFIATEHPEKARVFYFAFTCPAFVQKCHNWLGHSFGEVRLLEMIY